MVISLGFQIGSAMQQIALYEDNGTTGALKVMSSPHPMWAILEFLFWCGIEKTEPSWITGWYPGLKSCSRSRITGSATLAVMFCTCASEALQEGVCARFWLRCDRRPLPNLCVFTIENYMG